MATLGITRPSTCKDLLLLLDSGVFVNFSQYLNLWMGGLLRQCYRGFRGCHQSLKNCKAHASRLNLNIHILPCCPAQVLILEEQQRVERKKEEDEGFFKVCLGMEAPRVVQPAIKGNDLP